MYSLGHFAVGYFVFTLFRRVNNKRQLLFIWVLSMLPDLDAFFGSLIIHRGPSHSVIIIILFFIPFYLYFKVGIEYLAVCLSHSIIGDYFTGPVKLLWPLSNDWYSAPNSLLIPYSHLFIVELGLFLLMCMHLIYVKTIKVH